MMIVLFSNATISSFNKRVSKIITQYGQYFYLQRWMERSTWVRIDFILYYITLICNRGYYYSTIEWRRMRKFRVINENFWSTIKAIFHSYSLHNYLNKILSILRSAGGSTCVIVTNYNWGLLSRLLEPLCMGSWVRVPDMSHFSIHFQYHPPYFHMQSELP